MFCGDRVFLLQLNIFIPQPECTRCRSNCNNTDFPCRLYFLTMAPDYQMVASCILCKKIISIYPMYCMQVVGFLSILPTFVLSTFFRCRLLSARDANSMRRANVVCFPLMILTAWDWRMWDIHNKHRLYIIQNNETHIVGDMQISICSNLLDMWLLSVAPCWCIAMRPWFERSYFRELTTFPSLLYIRGGVRVFVL